MDAEDCIALSSRTHFTTYVGLLRNATGGNFSLIQDCRIEVCGAIWGSGNPDISGIGMAIGYLLESVICALLVGASIWFDVRAKKCPDVLASALRAFYDNAIFFTFVIQAASIITLSRVDFGIDTGGMGGFTMEIAWLISTLTLLPLLPMVLRPKLFTEGGRTAKGITGSLCERGTVPEDGRPPEPTSGCGLCSKRSAEARQKQRFLFFVVCWAMGFCPFFSRMGGTFGTSRRWHGNTSQSNSE
jgi:hypothetical protein